MFKTEKVGSKTIIWGKIKKIIRRPNIKKIEI